MRGPFLCPWHNEGCMEPPSHTADELHKHIADVHDNRVGSNRPVSYLSHGKCKICEAKYYAKGFCRKHYDSQWRAGKGICTFIGCGRNCHARGLCRKHYNAWWKRGANERSTADTSL